jgi:hypothetical protein
VSAAPAGAVWGTVPLCMAVSLLANLVVGCGSSDKVPENQREIG